MVQHNFFFRNVFRIEFHECKSVITKLIMYKICLSERSTTFIDFSNDTFVIRFMKAEKQLKYEMKHSKWKSNLFYHAKINLNYARII